MSKKKTAITSAVVIAAIFGLIVYFKVQPPGRWINDARFTVTERLVHKDKLEIIVKNVNADPTLFVRIHLTCDSMYGDTINFYDQYRVSEISSHKFLKRGEQANIEMPIPDSARPESCKAGPGKAYQYLYGTPGTDVVLRSQQ